MVSLTPVLERAPVPTAEQQSALEFVHAIDSFLGELPEGSQTKCWPHFPSKEGHPGFGVGGELGYGDQQGMLEVTRDGNTYHVTLGALEGEHIGVPHFSITEPQRRSAEPAEFRCLTAELSLADKEKPLRLLAVTDSGDLIPQELTLRELRYFTDRCVKICIKKVKEQRGAQAIGAMAAHG